MYCYFTLVIGKSSKLILLTLPFRITLEIGSKRVDFSRDIDIIFTLVTRKITEGTLLTLSGRITLVIWSKVKSSRDIDILPWSSEQFQNVPHLPYPVESHKK